MFTTPSRPARFRYNKTLCLHYSVTQNCVTVFSKMDDCMVWFESALLLDNYGVQFNMIPYPGLHIIG